MFACTDEVSLPIEEYGDPGSLTIVSGESHSDQAELVRDAVDNFERRTNTPLRMLRASSCRSKPVRKSTTPRERLSEDEEESKNRARRRLLRSQDDEAECPDAATAAEVKASRERKRRERLNDSFADLTMVLDPERSLKMEKPVIIADTIKIIKKIRSENGRLRQDMHQLEALLLQERLADSEEEKRELMFQHSLVKNALENIRLTYAVQPTSLASLPQLDYHTPGQATVAGWHSVGHELPDQTSQSPLHMGGLSSLSEGQASNCFLHLPPTFTPLYETMSMARRNPPANNHENSPVYQPAYSPVPPYPHAPLAAEVSNADLFELGSPPADFLPMGLDLGMNEALADLGKGSFGVAQMSMSPIMWPPAGDEME